MGGSPRTPCLCRMAPHRFGDVFLACAKQANQEGSDVSVTHEQRHQFERESIVVRDGARRR